MTAQLYSCARCFLFMAILVAPTHVIAEVAAKVEFVLGAAFVQTGAGEKRELVKGSSVEVGDTVISEDARVQLRFTDGGFVSLAPHSEFRVNAYSYSGKPDGSERVAMELMKGGLRTISGLIGKAIQSAYEMKTAVATMGIRGTEYTVVYGETVSGTVSAGAIAVCNAGGCLDVPQGKSYAVADANTKPVFINKTAAFLPPPQPEKAVQSKHPEETKGETTLNRDNTPLVAKHDRQRKDDDPQLIGGHNGGENHSAQDIRQRQSEQAWKGFELRDSSTGHQTKDSINAPGNIPQTARIPDDNVLGTATSDKGKGRRSN